MNEFLDPPFPADTDTSARAASLRSRDAVQRGDKKAWLSLFCDDGVVQDPVGVSPFDPSGDGHRGKEAISAFWDSAIGPNSIRMDIRSSHAGANEVANVLRMTTTIDGGTKVSCDLVAIYKVRQDGLIESLRAFWEFDALEFS